MKKLLKFAAIFGMTTLLSFSLKAQVPQGINYQAVARDGAGNILNNTNLDVKIGIYDGPSTSGTLVYEETIAVTTSVYGVFGLVIGSGTASTGVFNTIDWSNGDYYTKIDVDLGSGFVNLSESKLQSVPFALHAKTADSVTNKQWTEDATSLSTTKKVGVNGVPSGNYGFEAKYLSADSVGIYAISNDQAIMGVSTIGAPTFGVLGLQSTSNMFGMNISAGREIGMMGVSTGGSVSDNYGVIGFSNNKAGWFVNTNGSEALLGGAVNAAEFKHGGVLIDSVTTTPAPKTMYGNSGPLAYGHIAGTTFLANYGLTSVTNLITGTFVITLNNSYIGNPVVVATSLN